ncbi:patatin-like phospholipase family protein [Desulfuribacillus alkaliarsenatis]|uniref:PNPLA domain-containing protein n=1 Tax=Desulfuribacillus alkaliarsenatis TaxID=766136 RepID=A0A1E5G6J0_9FIRM|nr:patatin-like phospholipase family protein [Desulfuribacillus alkaliarsenatis]OEF98709.1 hypothetical protein BHF68_03345 [Desulfuribacillus alkaliarsenatis]
MKIGLALGSGGLKGAAHIGVIKALEDANIPIDMIAGTSAGSVISSLYYSGFNGTDLEALAKEVDLESYVDYTLSLSNIIIFLSAVFLRKLSFNVTPTKILPKGLVRGKLFEDYLNTLFKQKNCKNIPIFITSTDLHSAKQVVFTNASINKTAPSTNIEPLSDLANHVRASIAIPGVFMPVCYKDKLLVDGGVSNNVPADLLYKAGADKVIAVNLQSSLHKDNSIDTIFETMTRSIDILMVNNTKLRLSRYEYYLISPNVSDVKLNDFNKLHECIEVGYSITQQALPKIKAYLKS